jgi:hypothetical protein
LRAAQGWGFFLAFDFVSAGAAPFAVEGAVLEFSFRGSTTNKS